MTTRPKLRVTKSEYNLGNGLGGGWYVEVTAPTYDQVMSTRAIAAREAASHGYDPYGAGSVGLPTQEGPFKYTRHVWFYDKRET